MKNSEIPKTLPMEKAVFTLVNWLDFVEQQHIVGGRKAELSECFLTVFEVALDKTLKSAKIECSPVLLEYAVNWCENHAENSDSSHYKECLLALKRHLWGNRTDFRFLLVAEILYTLKTISADNGTLNEFLSSMKKRNAIIHEIMESLLLSDSQIKKAFILKKQKSKKLAIEKLKELSEIKNKRIQESFVRFAEFEKQENDYNGKPVFNIVVCATMSAGKSSFVNALLGHDVLPARNEATTARITSVYDKDGAATIVGFVHGRSGRCEDLHSDISLSEIDKWNTSSNVSRIFLQGDLDGIKNNGFITAVHDTPGTNNSGDKSHHDVTFDFLAKNNMDMLVYVANAEHLGTTDEKDLLTELHQKVISRQNIPVIFVLNKADNIDTEKEDLATVIAGYRDFVSDIGFADAQIFPVSAKAARLLKMARNNQSGQFTAKEQRECASMLAQFTDLHNFGSGVWQHDDADDMQTVAIGSRQHPLSEVLCALERTGLPQIEQYVEHIIERLLNTGVKSNTRVEKDDTALVETKRRKSEDIARVPTKASNKLNTNIEKDNTSLIEATKNNDVDAVRALIAAGADVNARDKDGTTALICAVSQVDVVDVARILIDAGAEVNAKTVSGQTALMRAAFSGNADMAHLLIEAGADVNATSNSGYTALMVAEKKNSMDVARLLIDASSKLNTRVEKDDTALMEVKRCNSADVAHVPTKASNKLNARVKKGNNTLMEAAQNNDVDAIKKVIKTGADVNATDEYGRTALMHAARNNSAYAVHALIEAGADMNARNDCEYGTTALIYAAGNNATDAARVLIRCGAGVNIKDKNGRTALMRAVRNNEVNMVRVLIYEGTNMNVRDKKGQTALMHATSNNSVDIISRMLIDAGADVNTKDNNGCTALMCATKKNAVNIVRMLIEAGADMNVRTMLASPR